MFRFVFVGRLLQWGWMALNTDGAAKGAPSGGVGLFRDNLGKMHCVYSLREFMVEVKAIDFGLEMARRMQIKKL